MHVAADVDVKIDTGGAPGFAIFAGITGKNDGLRTGGFQRAGGFNDFVRVDFVGGTDHRDGGRSA